MKWNWYIAIVFGCFMGLIGECFRVFNIRRPSTPRGIASRDIAAPETEEVTTEQELYRLQDLYHELETGKNVSDEKFNSLFYRSKNDYSAQRAEKSRKIKEAKRLQKLALANSTNESSITSISDQSKSKNKSKKKSNADTSFSKLKQQFPS